MKFWLSNNSQSLKFSIRWKSFDKKVTKQYVPGMKKSIVLKHWENGRDFFQSHFQSWSMMVFRHVYLKKISIITSVRKCTLSPLLSEVYDQCNLHWNSRVVTLVMQKVIATRNSNRLKPSKRFQLVTDCPDRN